MDRINGADTIDIGGGRRGFRDENLVAGAAGTEVTALFLNMVQEEILKVITEAGLAPSEGDWTQLWQALQIHGLSADSRSRRWLSVISMTLSSAPGAPSAGDTYLIPTGATGIWATHVGEIAQWTGSAWSYLTPPDGHGISLPDGRVFERIAGTYVEKLALDAQSGKWTYAVAGGTANALTATLNPAPASLVAGMRVTLMIAVTNTGPATLNLNGHGAVNIKRPAAAALQAGDLTAGAMVDLEYDGAQWQIPGMPLAAGGISVFTASGTFVVPDGVTAIRRVRVWGGGGGGGGSSGANSGGAGGGGGAYSERVNIKVSPGDSIAVSVGSGGTAGTAAPTGGGSGGTSSFGAYATATGGAGGFGGANGYQTNGAVGGTASGGQLGVSGSSGGTPFLVAGSASFSGVGGSSPFGGGSPGVNTGTSGSPGIFPGGGANSGTSGNAGGEGASGMVVVEY